MRSKEQIAVLHDLFNQINERLGIIGETPDAYFLCQCVEILKQQGVTIDTQAPTPSEPLEELLGQYWDIAYKEGKSGEPNGDKANEVLHKIRQLFKHRSEA